MGVLGRANLKKAVYYLKRNGWKNTWYAAKERLEERRKKPYSYVPPGEEELKAQRKMYEGEKPGSLPVTFSIVVPAYRTEGRYLRELVESVLAQTYPGWELILADATEDDSVERQTRQWTDERIRYQRLGFNEGIARNTNAGISLATGTHVGLLDHDDLLAPDALFHMVRAICDSRQAGVEPGLLYSDEDKCNGEGTDFFEPNYKEDFNLDLLLSNNYICHFQVMKREWIQKLEFRGDFDGSQDYDLALRAVDGLMEDERQIVHVPRVLYHWRCHTGSTAENPKSKQYAYDAGLRAVQDFADRQGWKARAVALKHLGFYQLQYQEDVLAVRQDLGAVGGRILAHGRTVGGRMSREGKVYYEGLPGSYSGYLHRAVLPQDAEALDIRCIRIRQECVGLFEEITGVPYRTVGSQGIFDSSTLPEDCDYKSLSLALSKTIAEKGYRLLYLPELEKCEKNF